MMEHSLVGLARGLPAPAFPCLLPLAVDDSRLSPYLLKISIVSLLFGITESALQRHR